MPGGLDFLGCQDTYYVGTLKRAGRVYAQTIKAYVAETLAEESGFGLELSHGRLSAVTPYLRSKAIARASSLHRSTVLM